MGTFLREVRLSVLSMLAVVVIGLAVLMGYGRVPLIVLDEEQNNRPIIVCYAYTPGVPYPWHPVPCDLSK